MIPYKKGRFKGYKPYLEIYRHEKKGFMIHYSDPKLNLQELIFYLMQYIHDFFSRDLGEIYDTAKPEDRKKLNKKWKR